MNEKVKWRSAGRLRRGSVILGVVGLAAGAAVMSAGSAFAGVGSQPGDLTLSSTTGAVTLSPTWETTDGCPTGFQGSGEISSYTSSGTFVSRVSTIAGSVTAAFGGTLDGNIGQIANQVGVGVAAGGGTMELAVNCYSAAGGTGSAEAVQSIFVTVVASSSTYTTSSTGPVLTATTTTLTATPSPAGTGATVTLSAGVTATDSTTPAGTVQFVVNGTDFGTPVAVNTGGVAAPATTTTSFPSQGTQNLSAIFTPTATTYAGSTGNTSLSVQVAGTQTAGSEPVTVTVPISGSFSVAVASGSVVLNPAAPATTPDETATGSLQNVTVTDSRNDYPGWSVSGQEADFTGSGTAAGQTISGNDLGWTPAVVGSLVDNATLGALVAPVGANTGSSGPGIGSNAATLASATPGNGFGQNVLSASLLLDIPASTVAGPYAGSLTITYVETGP
jgi:hypothetical protein